MQIRLSFLQAMPKRILDLCSGTGAWSQPYLEAGYEVLRIDLPTDVRTLRFVGRVHGILAAPPCTMFSLAKRPAPSEPEDFKDALSIVDACLRFVAVCEPEWWALENPRGRLHWWLGPPTLEFHPCHYGNPWTKLTNLWGSFNIPEFKEVAPAQVTTLYDVIDGRELPRKVLRAMTPPGFARAFFEANP